MAKPEGECDKADDGGDAGPVDIGLLHIADDFHQQHPDYQDDGENDDKPYHAAPLLEAIAPARYVGSDLALFRMPLPGGPLDAG